MTNWKNWLACWLLCGLLLAAPLNVYAQEGEAVGEAAVTEEAEVPQGAGTFALLLGIAAVGAVGFFYLRQNTQSDEQTA